VRQIEFAADEADARARKTPETVVRAMAAGRIISRNNSPDVPFDRSINPYQGCEHGCVYCYARPSHSYLGLSPGLDFETRMMDDDAAFDTNNRAMVAVATEANLGWPVRLGRFHSGWVTTRLGEVGRGADALWSGLTARQAGI